ncbi:SRPBCC family protein [Gordonia jacobaea]|uniref:SRPBCC family protein n=1 Tax=Gordonia jacobaea TaxID=122202 RepID=UPI003D725DA0
MAIWTTLDPVDLSYFDTAQHSFSYDIDIPGADPDTVWADIVAPQPLPWVRALRGHYLSPEPLGVGSRREVAVLRGVMTLREHFFLWDNTIHRHSFYATEASVPLFRSFAEDYQVTALGSGSRFTWRFAFDARRGFGPIVAAGVPLNRRLFASIIGDTQRHFDTQYPAQGVIQ